MEHLAIMRKSWGMMEKILSGEKTIESRWYNSRRQPWNRIKAGDKVYFKNSGEPVKVKAEVAKVMQFQGLTPSRVREVLRSYGNLDGIRKADASRFFTLFRNKKYCILVFLKGARRTRPFNVDKKGFGIMSSWICVKSISQISIKDEPREIRTRSARMRKDKKA